MIEFELMAIDLRSYGRLPLLAAAWCFWGTCFYSFLVYQMYGERGRRNRVSSGLTACLEVLLAFEYFIKWLR